MALSNIRVPLFTSVIPVDSRVNNLKVLLLPTVSTNSGQFILFKDYYGTSSNSTFTISTSGTDLIDDITPSYTFSNAFGSIGFVSDGLRSWRTLGFYNGGLTPAAPGPNYVVQNLVYFLDAGNVSSYPGSGNTWTDLMGTGKNVTLYNSPTYSSANGGYLRFVNTSAQYGECTSSFPLMSNYTIEVWLYHTGYTGTYPVIVGQIFPGTTSKIAYSLGNASMTMPVIQNAYYTGAWQASVGFVPTVNNWYHIVGTYDGINIKLYVNNSIIGSTANATAIQSNTSGFRLMRRWDNADYWGGNLAIYRAYNRALTVSEISQNFNSDRSRFGL